MLRAIVLFEFRYQLTRGSTLTFLSALFGYAALMVARAGGLLGAPFDLAGDGGAAALNSPRVLHQMVTLPCSFGILIVAAVMVSAACRDVRYRSEALFHTKPVSERTYLAGRLGGATLALAALFTAPALGLLAVTSLPAFPADRLEPLRLGSVLMPYVAVVWPNLLALGTLLFCASAASRREAPAYALSLALLGAWMAARMFEFDLAAAPAARPDRPVRGAGERGCAGPHACGPRAPHLRSHSPGSSCSTGCCGSPWPRQQPAHCWRASASPSPAVADAAAQRSLRPPLARRRCSGRRARHRPCAKSRQRQPRRGRFPCCSPSRVSSAPDCSRAGRCSAPSRACWSSAP